MFNPNPGIETRIRVQSLGTYSESKKYVATLLVVRHFLDLLDVLRGWAIIVFSVSGFGFTAFVGNPMILRLYGNASVIHKNDNQWADLYKLFDDYIGARQIFLMDIEMVQTSCGMAVPLYEFKEDREQLIDSFKRRGHEGIKAYWKQKNQISIDGKETNILTKNT